MKIKTSKGFTLIELLIVVAIIAILAAIAIPQFSAYRVRGYNAAASSDVRNFATAQEALFSDTQGYGAGAQGTQLAPTPGQAAVAFVAIAGPAIPAQAAPLAPQPSWAQIQNLSGAVGFALSNNVRLTTGAAGQQALPQGGLTDYTAITKNTAGDTCFGKNSNSSALYRLNAPSQANIALAVGDHPAPSQNTDSIGGQVGTGACLNGATVYTAI